MSNADLIAEARAFRPGGGDYLDVRLADALEAADNDHYNSEKVLIDTVHRQADLIDMVRAEAQRLVDQWEPAGYNFLAIVKRAGRERA